MIAFVSHEQNSKTVFCLLDSVVNQKRQYPSIPHFDNIYNGVSQLKGDVTFRNTLMRMKTKGKHT